MLEAPEPCVTCRVFYKHDCKLQAVCTRVKRYWEASINRNYYGYTSDTIQRNTHRKGTYKGGLQ